MRKLCFALAVSFFTWGCERHSESEQGTPVQFPVPTPTMVNDTPPPHPEIDPDMQQDQSGPHYKDSIIPGTGMTRHQRDSIRKWENGYVQDDPGKGVSTRTDYLVVPIPGQPYDTALYNRQAPIREHLERNKKK